MIHDPMDIFDEMDEMFDRLFLSMRRQAPACPLNGTEYPSGILESDEEAGPVEAYSAGRLAFEPAADVQRIGNEVKVLADLPGISPDSLRLGVRNGVLIIDGGDADYHYHTSTALPPVDSVSMTHTLKNGVLEVSFRALPDNQGPR